MTVALGLAVPARPDSGLPAAPLDLASLPPPPTRNPFARALAEDVARLRRDAGTPQSIVPLLELPSLWDEVDPRAVLAALLAVAGDPHAHPLVRAAASELAAGTLDDLGRESDAAARRAALGFVTRVQVVGPFPNDGRSGFDRAYPPESDLAGSLRGPVRGGPAGGERDVRWRPLGDLARTGFVALDGAIRPSDAVVAYALAFVRAARPETVALRVGSAGAVKVMMGAGGALRTVLRREAYRAYHLDQDAAAVALPAGWTALLVKVASDGSGLGFSLRFTDLAGRPLAPGAVEVSDDPSLLGRAVALPPAPTATPADLENALRERADAAEKRAARGHDPAAARAAAGALRDLGVYLREATPEPPEAHAAEDALEKAVALAPGPEVLRELALAETEYDKRRQDEERALALLPAGCATRPDAVGVSVVRGAAASGAAAARLLREIFLVDVAEAYDARGEPVAYDLYREALACDPSFYPARLRLAEAVADHGLSAAALRTLRPLGDALPDVPAVRRALYERYLQAGRVVDARAERKALLASHATDGALLRAEADDLRRQGDLEAALALYRRVVHLHPERSDDWIALADELTSAERPAAAAAALDDALALAPDEPLLHQALGLTDIELGRTAAARAELARALELKPQSPELREYLAHLDAGGGAAVEDLAATFHEDVPALVAADRQALSQPRYASAGAVVLLDLEATRVHENGLSESFVQRVVRVQDATRAAGYSEVAIPYTPDTQSVDVREARVYKADGTVQQAAGRSDRDLSDPEVGMYYDEREEVVELAGVAAGDVVDVEYVVSDVARRNLFADYFGDLHFFAEDVPRLDSRYVLVAPHDRKLYFRAPALPGLVHHVHESAAAGTRTYFYRAEDVPPLPSEPGMPGASEVAPYLHVSTYGGWAEVGAWYWGLVKDQLTLDDAMRRAAEDAVRGAAGVRDKVRRIHDLVVRETRYVGLELGIHGYKPYRTTQVFQRKFGDCKDKASLLVVLLQAVGVPAELVAVRTRDLGEIDPSPASLAVFDHAIAYVPSLDLYLDGTAEFSGIDELPAQDQGVMVLRIHDGTGVLARTPVLPAATNARRRELDVALAASGAAVVRETVRIAGQQAAEWRRRFQAPAEQRDRYEAAWNEEQPGAHLRSVQLSGLSDLGAAVEARAELEVPAFAHAGGGALRMPVAGHAGEMTRTYARLSARETDLVLPYPWVADQRVTIDVPPGYRVAQLPPPVELATRFGRFSLTSAAAGGGERQVVVRLHTEMTVPRVARADYPDFRAFCDAMDDAMNRELVLAR